MACFYPLEGWRTPSGGFSASPRAGFTDLPKMKVGCGQCIGCRLDRARDWSARIMHQASLSPANCFITLTYDDLHLPRPATLQHSHFQKFIAKVRRKVGLPISYFMCGEYGDRTTRPHYHAIIFGYDFGGRIWRPDFGSFPRLNRAQKGCYSSEELSRYWTYGYNAVGPVTPASAKYVASYCLKKVTGVRADEHYKRVDPDTGEVYWLVPEYARMSTRPAIGKAWFDRYSDDVLKYDGVFMDGKKQPVPRYYDKLREQRDAARLAATKLKRRIKALDHARDNTPERLVVREVVTKSRLSLKQRKL